MQITLFLNDEEKTFVTPKFVSALIYRKALRLQADGMFPAVTEEHSNEVIGLICEAFDHQFTIDEFWAGCHVTDMNKYIDKFIRFVNGIDVDEDKTKKGKGKQ